MCIDRVRPIVVVSRNLAAIEEVLSIKAPSALERAGMPLVAGRLHVIAKRAQHVASMKVVDERPMIAAAVCPRSIGTLVGDDRIDGRARRVAQLPLLCCGANARE